MLRWFFQEITTVGGFIQDMMQDIASPIKEIQFHRPILKWHIKSNFRKFLIHLALSTSEVCNKWCINPQNLRA